MMARWKIQPLKLVILNDFGFHFFENKQCKALFPGWRWIVRKRWMLSRMAWCQRFLRACKRQTFGLDESDEWLNRTAGCNVWNLKQEKTIGLSACFCDSFLVQWWKIIMLGDQIKSIHPFCCKKSAEESFALFAEFRAFREHLQCMEQAQGVGIRWCPLVWRSMGMLLWRPLWCERGEGWPIQEVTNQGVKTWSNRSFWMKLCIHANWWKAAVVTGQGKAFAAGADIKEWGFSMDCRWW